MMEEGAVLQRILVGKERETVTDQVMEVLMTDTEVVVETLCVAVTIVSSLVLTTMRKTTVVSVQQGTLQEKPDQDRRHKVRIE